MFFYTDVSPCYFIVWYRQLLKLFSFHFIHPVCFISVVPLTTTHKEQENYPRQALLDKFTKVCANNFFSEQKPTNIAVSSGIEKKNIIHIMTVTEANVKDTEMEVDPSEDTTNKDQDVVHILEIREHIRKIDKAVISNEYR